MTPSTPPPLPVVQEEARTLLQHALTDGQLTWVEFEERSGAVDDAVDAAEVERHVHDLQAPPHSRSVRARRALARARHAVVRNWQVQPLGTRIAAAVGVVVFAGVTALAVVQGPGDQTDPPPAVSTKQGRLTSGVEELRTAWQAEFGTTLVGRVQIDPGYVRVHQPVETDPPRVQEWTWVDGRFSAVGRVKGGEPGVVDLADIDVDAVEEVLRRGVAELGVESPSTVTTLLGPASSGGEPRIWMFIRNEYGEEASVSTNMAGGDVRRRSFGEED